MEKICNNITIDGEHAACKSSLLKRLRLGKHRRNDLETLKSRRVDRNYPSSSIYKELIELQKRRKRLFQLFLEEKTVGTLSTDLH